MKKWNPLERLHENAAVISDLETLSVPGILTQSVGTGRKLVRAFVVSSLLT